MSDIVDFSNLEQRMNGAIDAVKKDLTALRTGRATPALLEPVAVDAYGSLLPINQVASVTVSEARVLSVAVWDKALVSLVDKAIRNAGLGLNPIIDGTLIRIPIPELSQERRKELVKLTAKYSEQAKIAVRNVRRDGMDNLKALESKSKISIDEHKVFAEKIQELTDKMIAEISELAVHKEKELMTI